MRMLPILAMCLLATGCAPYGPGDVAPPNAISVDEAFKDVGQGLADFRKLVDADDADGSQHKLGVITCRIIVHFNIAAAAGRQGGVGATLAVPIQAIKVSANASEADQQSAMRGNSVVVDLASINPQICAWYEKPSDMVNTGSSTQSGGSTASSEGSSTGGQTNNKGTTTNTGSNKQTGGTTTATASSTPPKVAPHLSNDINNAVVRATMKPIDVCKLGFKQVCK